MHGFGDFVTHTMKLSLVQNSVITFARLLSNKGLLVFAICYGSGNMIPKTEIVGSFYQNLKFYITVLKDSSCKIITDCENTFEISISTCWTRTPFHSTRFQHCPYLYYKITEVGGPVGKIFMVDN